MVAVPVGLFPVAPVPPDARALVAGLSDESQKVRDQSIAALRERPDAGPWVRRAALSPDRDTAQRAVDLLVVYAKKRQAAVPRAIDACIRAGQADLFIEWYHFWQPESKDELWSVGLRAGKAGLEEYAKLYPGVTPNPLEEGLAELYAFPPERWRAFDGPSTKLEDEGPWRIRTNWLSTRNNKIAFASVAGSITVSGVQSGYFFTLGGLSAKSLTYTVVVCEGGLVGREHLEVVSGPDWIGGSFVVCRGNVEIPTAGVASSVILVDGDVDLSMSTHLQNVVVRASGEIRLPKEIRAKRGKPEKLVIEAHVKNPTAPYKFFELTDVGLSLVDDEEGLVVADVKPDTPFGRSGIARGDVVRLIDDARAGHSEELRKQVRRAMVVQGDCLLTVARGQRVLDLAVQFPLPK